MIEYSALGHAMLVHFPIALLTLAALVEVMRYCGFKIYAQVTYILLVVATLASLPAAGLGLFASQAYAENWIIGTHMLLGLSTSAFSIVGTVLYFFYKEPLHRLLITGFLATLVGVTGFFGGEVSRGTFLSASTEISASSIHEVFEKYSCTKCHSGPNPKGQLNLTKVDFSEAEITNIFLRISKKLGQKGAMPPTGPRVSNEDKLVITDYLEDNHPYVK